MGGGRNLGIWILNCLSYMYVACFLRRGYTEGIRLMRLCLCLCARHSLAMYRSNHTSHVLKFVSVVVQICSCRVEGHPVKEQDAGPFVRASI